MSDIEGKVAREAMSECEQRASFKISAHLVTVVRVRFREKGNRVKSF